MPIVLTKPTLDVGIVTTDPAPMVEFYGELLGLPRLDDIRMPGFTIIRFELGDVVLKVLEYDEKPGTPAATGGIGAGTGIRYITVSVEKIADALAACRASTTASVLEEPVEVRPGAWIAFGTDPDGNVIEFVQRGGTL
ncbi:VOC family protein [Gordonia jinghuaiqii]|uniref:VOC family protein n=1 Tax=Gordonia jinghuaiqii TaxID=2758710 RepID=A0A7D7R1E6_9ACTN|nr:VOC family protein [Gordonia jinghuaiqii]MCR5980571.1 VOC family protein [Gordonia jinghuaiqii]QMT02631.1 VOC family protein [Gordonia jinghuaiqii]